MDDTFVFPEAEFHYVVKRKDGTVKHEGVFHNQVMTAGKNDLLDKYFAGSGYTAAWYLGTVDNSAFSAYAASQTMDSHAGWLEHTDYSAAARLTLSWNAAAAGSKASQTANFTATSASVLKGLMVGNSNVKGGATAAAILYSAGSFTAARTLAASDILAVTVTFGA